MTPAKPRSTQKRIDRCSLAGANAEVTVSGSMIADLPAHNCEKETVMQYSPAWDLSSIPESIFASERARRVAAKRKKFGQPKIAPCKDCGRLINARQRRFPCPFHVPPPASDAPNRVNKSRDEVMLAVALAIAEVGRRGPGRWHVEKTGRRDVTLSYKVRKNAERQVLSPKEEKETAAYDMAVWQEYGGNEILKCAGILGKYEHLTIHWSDGKIVTFMTIPCGG